MRPRRIAPIGLTRELPLSAMPSIIVHEPFDELPVFNVIPTNVAQSDTRTLIRPWSNPSNLYVREKRRTG
jgi:hypothetical protein